jgi:hypothetical protein
LSPSLFIPLFRGGRITFGGILVAAQRIVARLIGVIAARCAAAPGLVSRLASLIARGGVLPRFRRIAAVALVAGLARPIVGRLVLAGAARAVARRILAATFLAVARAIASLLALRIAVLFAASRGGRLSRIARLTWLRRWLPLRPASRPVIRRPLRLLFLADAGVVARGVVAGIFLRLLCVVTNLLRIVGLR